MLVFRQQTLLWSTGSLVRLPDAALRSSPEPRRALRPVNPDAAAQAMVDEFGIELDTAKRPWHRSSGFQPASSAAYLGTKAEVGAMADALMSQARFLSDRLIELRPCLLSGALSLSYIEKALENDLIE